MQVVIFQQYTRRDCVLTDEIFIRKKFFLLTSSSLLDSFINKQSVHKYTNVVQSVKLCHSEILFKCKL